MTGGNRADEPPDICQRRFALHNTIYAADWSVLYPVACDVHGVLTLLRGLLIKYWSWNLFLWDLRECLRLLVYRPTEFNYLHVVRLLSARAAHLAMTGPFECSLDQLRTGLARERVQFASIYIRLFERHLKATLLPAAGRRTLGPGEDRLFMMAIAALEDEYRKVLQVCCLSADRTEVFYGLDVESWSTGKDLYAPVACMQRAVLSSSSSRPTYGHGSPAVSMARHEPSNLIGILPMTRQEGWPAWAASFPFRTPRRPESLGHPTPINS